MLRDRFTTSHYDAAFSCMSLASSGGFAISAVELTCRFGSLIAVDHIWLQIPYGGIFGLLGANGAGKSTFIKMPTTLLSPTLGQAEVGGHDIVASPAKARRSSTADRDDGGVYRRAPGQTWG